PYVYVSYVDAKTLNNVVFFASENELSSEEVTLQNLIPQEDAVVFTDDFNPIEQFSIPIIDEWRNMNIKVRGAEILVG
ncbi:MAG: hypothetical protein V1672_01240, partial [Candidatus Diapherotrites archaeon]